MIERIGGDQVTMFAWGDWYYVQVQDLETGEERHVFSSPHRDVAISAFHIEVRALREFWTL